MTGAEIKSLVRSLPAASPYYSLVLGTKPGDPPPTLIERVRIALADPALGWHAPEAYAGAGLPLPNFNWPPAVRRAHASLSAPGREDECLMEARALQLPDQMAERDLIRALLMCRDSTDEAIAELLGLEAGVIHLFQLWWNIRQRKEELPYVTQLVNGQLALGGAGGVAAQNSRGVHLMRLALATGQTKVVLAEAGIACPGEGEPADAFLLEQIERMLLAEAASGQQLGNLGKEQNPALALVEKHLRGGQEPVAKPSIFTDPLLALSQDPEAQRVLRRLFQQKANEQLAAIRQSQGQEAAAEPSLLQQIQELQQLDQQKTRAEGGRSSSLGA